MIRSAERTVRIAAGVVALALVLPACQGSSGTSGTQAGPSASVKIAQASASAKAAFEANPQLQKDTRTALDEVQVCAKTAQVNGKPIGLVVSLPLPYSGGKPTVGTVPYVVVRHPAESFDAIVLCTPAGKAGPAAAKACVKQVIQAGGLGKGVLGRDLTMVATQCLVITPTPSVSPAAS